MHSFSSFFISFSILLLGARAQSPAKCKITPASNEWPTAAEWAALNTTIAGRLLKPLAPASACHRNQPNYNPESCEEVNSEWKNTEWHSNNPTSSLWQNYNNYSCMPDAASPCSTNGYPVYVVAARSGADIKAGVDFARTKNIRINIKSTGHDFLGRSVQPNSLSIWTHNLKSQKFTNSFVPEGCKFSIPGTTITVGSGSQWGEVSSAVNARDLMIVAGASKTVGVGGFLSSGGHGALSAKFGLGADMVAEIELVTADGKIIKANECQNEDYFWAMRGGGGSTYGVAVAYTIQTIPTVPTARWAGRLSDWDQIIYMHTQWPKLAARGVSGYINGYPGRSGSASISMTMPNATDRRVLEAILDPILAGMSGREGGSSRGSSGGQDDDDRRTKRSTQIQGQYTHYQTFAEAYEYHIGSHDAGLQETNGAQATFPGTGSNKIITSWLWSTEDCASPNLGAALRGAIDTDTQLLNDMTMGTGTWKPPYLRGGSNAVNPAFRTATMRPAAELQWTGTNPVTLAKKKVDALKFGASLKSLNPSGGTYANEADPDSPDWQHAFWGANYERLYSIKRAVDPTGIFYCRSCVGSELWEDVDGILCKK